MGKPWPPNSAGWITPCQPPSVNCLKASLKTGEVVTTPSFQLLGSFVAFPVQRGDNAFAEPGRLFEHRLGGVDVVVLKPGRAVTLGRPASSCITNSMSFRGGLVAHDLISGVRC